MDILSNGPHLVSLQWAEKVTRSQTEVMVESYIISPFRHHPACTFLLKVMTPQLMEDGSEFLINEDEEGWIVSIDNSVVIFMSILSGFLQTKYGPMKVMQY